MPDTQLSKIIAVEPTVKKRATDELTRAYHQLQVNALFGGRLRQYQPVNDDDPELLPDEQEPVQGNVVDLVNSVRDVIVDFWDVTATKDWGNLGATASVKVGDRVLLADAPVPFLIFLDKKLVDLRTFISKLPVLSADHTWEYDQNIGMHRAQPVVTNRYKKFPRTLVKAEATEHHPAQVDVWQEDVVVGRWSNQAFSSAIPVDTRNELLANVDVLIKAVKEAREEANATEVENRHVAADIWDFVFNGLDEFENND